MRVKCVPVTGIAKGTAMPHNNGCLLVRHEDHQWPRWSLDTKRFKQNRSKIEKNKRKFFLAVINDYSSNYSELLQGSGSLSIETQLAKLFRL